MSTDQTPIQLRRRAVRTPVDADLADSDLLDFVLEFAGPRPARSATTQLLAEFGNVDAILSSEAEMLTERGGLSDRAVAILKLLNAFRTDSRTALLLH